MHLHRAAAILAAMGDPSARLLRGEYKFPLSESPGVFEGSLWVWITEGSARDVRLNRATAHVALPPAQPASTSSVSYVSRSSVIVDGLRFPASLNSCICSKYLCSPEGVTTSRNRT